MHPPSVAVERLLYGTGVGLMLGTGFALQSGRSFGGQPPFLELFLVFAVACFALGWTLSKGMAPLASWFSSETEEAMSVWVRTDIDEIQRSEEVAAKWAELEAKVLTRDLGEEE